MKTEHKDQATPRPWKFGGVDSREIHEIETGRSVCKVEFRFGRLDSTARDNASLIVRAVNKYDALVAVAEAAQKIAKRTLELPSLSQLRSALDNLAAIADQT